MKLYGYLFFVIISSLILVSCGGGSGGVVPGNTPTPLHTPTSQPVATLTPFTLNRPEKVQLGLNFIRFYMGPNDTPESGLDTTTSYVQPAWIFSDFKNLKVQSCRQMVKADLFWDVVEPNENVWNFEAQDKVIKNPDFEPIVTLFAMQYSSGTPPWVKDPSRFQKTLGTEGKKYVETVVKRYKDYVKYWEIGNEMDHWKIADSGSSTRDAAFPTPSVMPSDGFSPQEQGIFLSQVASVIRQYDSDAVIILPGISGFDDYTINTWFAGVIQSSGKDWFDIVNYHYYSSWQHYSLQRETFQTFLKNNGLDGKPVWLTETGVTSSPTLTIWTDYPNSEESQSADIFRLIVQAYGHGDACVYWHTYMSTSDNSNNDWRLYGLRKEDTTTQMSYYTMKLLAEELIPFSSVTAITKNPSGANVYKVITSGGGTKYVAWGDGIYTVHPGITAKTSVIPVNNSFLWETVREGEKITLSQNPILLR